MNVLVFIVMGSSLRMIHRRLLLRLKACGIEGKVLKWIENWLKGRRQRVVLNGLASDWADVLSGVPHSSVLSHLLFSNL